MTIMKMEKIGVPKYLGFELDVYLQYSGAGCTGSNGAAVSHICRIRRSKR